MNKTQIIIAGIMGFLAVALGAFGAHGLKNIVTPDLLETYKTGVLYHLVHSVVLLTLALYGKTFNKSFWTIFTGVSLFSFSLYIYVITGFKFLVFVTPIGGVIMLVGWLLIIYEAMKQKSV